jgi:hypothetical protein
MHNGYHVAGGLKMQEHPREIARNGAVPLPPENNDSEENVAASGTSTRIQTLISAAIRVWELKTRNLNSRSFESYLEGRAGRRNKKAA